MFELPSWIDFTTLEHFSSFPGHKYSAAPPLPPSLKPLTLRFVRSLENRSLLLLHPNVATGVNWQYHSQMIRLQMCYSYC